MPFAGPVDPTVSGPPQHHSGARDVRDLVGARQTHPARHWPVRTSRHAQAEERPARERLANRQRSYCGIDTNHAAVITDTGILLEHHQFDTTTNGYDDLALWMRELGEPITVGIEGTSSYGAGITRDLRHLKITVVEVPRPNRKLRRSVGKSDPIDAEAAARAVLARPSTLRTQTRRRSHRSDPRTACRQIQRRQSRDRIDERHPRHARHRTGDVAYAAARTCSTTALLDACTALDPDVAQLADPVNATILALRSLANRTRQLRREANELKKHLAKLVNEVAPTTSAVFGLGPDTTAALLVTSETIRAA